MSLYRSLACIAFYDIRNSKRSEIGYSQCVEKIAKELAVSKLFQSSIREILDGYYISLGKNSFENDIPLIEMNYLACAYLTGCRLNIFKVDKCNIYISFSINNCNEGVNGGSTVAVNLLEESFNGNTVYKPLFTFKDFFQNVLINEDYDTHFKSLMNEEFVENFKGFFIEKSQSF